MARTLCKGAEAALPITTGAAVSFSEATVVRLVNSHPDAHLVTVVETRSGDVVGSFTMPAGSVEYLEKNEGLDRIPKAISWMFETETEGIILEDDCIPSAKFMKFAGKGLEIYRENKEVGFICLKKT